MQNKRRGGPKKAVIDIETLQVWDSLSSCADDIGCTKACVCASIYLGRRAKHHKLEHLSNWLFSTEKEKIKWAIYPNIGFFSGEFEV